MRGGERGTDMRRTDSRCLASWMAREQLVVVFPTPPARVQSVNYL